MIEDKFLQFFLFIWYWFYIFMTNAVNKGYNAYLRFVLRLVLAIAGMLHQLLQPGEHYRYMLFLE